MRSSRKLGWLVVLTALPALFAEQLPLRTYTTADGLANDHVSHVLQDSRGFLWFATSGGLSRFDGSRFATFGRAEGSPARSINFVLENRDGTFWLASNGEGLVHFAVEGAVVPASEGAAKARFRRYAVSTEPSTNRVNVLHRDRAGVLWLGTDGGLFRGDEISGSLRIRREELGLAGHPELTVQVLSLAEGHDGSLWVGTRFGLLRREPDGRLTHFSIEPKSVLDIANCLLFDTDGRLWIGHQSGLMVFWPKPSTQQPESAPGSTVDGRRNGGIFEDDTLRVAFAHRSSPAPLRLPERPGQSRFFPVGAGRGSHFVAALGTLADGRIWIGTINAGLFEFSGSSIRAVSKDRRLQEGLVRIVPDSVGNVWLATRSGVIKLSRRGVVRYGAEDGLDTGVSSVFGDHNGAVVVLSGEARVSRFDGDRFASAEVQLVKRSAGGAWGSGLAVLQDHLGAWWIGNRSGLYRLPSVDRVEQLGDVKGHHFTQADGFPEDYVTYLFEDSRGDLWISTFAPAHEVVTRWERATGKFHRYSEADGLPGFNAPLAIVEDGAGDVWIGFREGGLARWHAGRFEVFGPASGLPEGGIGRCFADHSGHVWCAASDGLLRIDRSEGSRLSLHHYTPREGLSSNLVYAIGEDREGRIYAGTARGVDCFDLQTGQARHYSVADGLAPGEARQIYRDSHGDLWFAMLSGLSRLRPGGESVRQPPEVRITGLQIGGVNYLLPAVGATELNLSDLPPGRSAVQIEFGALNLASDVLQYRYRLEGASNQWSEPTQATTVNYAALAPGHYRFAVLAEGGKSATITFRLLPPIWWRWWFLSAWAAVILALILAFARYRAGRIRLLRESEGRYRTLSETASDAIITVDEAGRILYANPACQSVFGYSAGELIGRELVSLMPDRLRPAHEAGFARYLRTGERRLPWQAIELPGLHRDGREVPLEISFGESIRDGRRYFTGIVRDISERKRAQEALRRSQEERLAELERVRRRIATDLHDDVGATLTQISVLSEVAQQQAGGSSVPVSRPLSLIASASRELVDTMSDIVWAINPHRDNLSELTHRVRRFASDTFTARNIAFVLRLPAEEEDRRLEGNLRREVFLIFKESVNNMVRHSGCNQAEIELCLEAGVLRLTLHDNGKGFEIGRDRDGHGLTSMRSRAAELGGSLEIESQSGRGTTVRATVPLTRPAETTTIRSSASAGAL